MVPGVLSGLLGRDTTLLRAIFAAAPGSLVLLDPDGRTLLGARTILGAVSQPARTQLLAALREGEPWGGEAELHARRVRLCLVPATESASLLLVTDCTAEQELRDQLLQAQRMQAVGQLAGGIAHDFNNLLTAILGAADDLASHPSRAPDDTADIAQIRESATRGAALVRQLMAFGRQQTLQPRVLSVNDAIRRATALLQRLLAEDINLTLDLEEPGRNVRIDPVQFDQVLVNLAVNAGHAMPHGGQLTITSSHALKLRPEPVGAETIPPGRYATIEVRDTGSGIDPGLLPRIFEPFFTTRRAEGGTGLGLSTVHGIIRQSGGYLTVESTVGQGTLFRILFPRDDSVPAPIPADSHPAQAMPSPTGPILLVEDEQAVRRLAERALNRAGWQVVAAGSAAEALACLPKTIGCVVSDVVMPGMDGPTLVKTLRQRQPGLPAILMSGYADSAQRQALAESDIRFLAKPFAMLDLVEAVGQGAGA
jgi:two-component system cell cycle sensor histidine kinase/response regulator CckA